MISIRCKVLGLIFILTVIPSLALIGILNARLARVLEEQTLDIASQFMKQNEGYLQLFFDDIATTLRYVSDTEVVRTAVGADHYDDLFDALLAFRRVSGEIDRMVEFKPDIGGLEIHAANGFSYRSGIPDFRQYEEVMTRPVFAPIRQADGRLVWLFDSGHGRLIVGRVLHDVGAETRPQSIGIALAYVPLHRIENILGRFRDGRDRHLLLYSRHADSIIGSADPPVDVKPFVGSDARSGQVSVRRTADDFFVASIPIGNVGLDLVMVVSTDSILSGASTLQHFLLFAILGVMFATAVAWIWFSVRITRPIANLAGTIEQFEAGRTDVFARIETRDEIGELAGTYNHMLSRLNQLIHDISAEQAHRRYAEWDALQAQINPHFLNNTLNSIGSLARMKGAHEITAMVAALSRMLSIIIYGNEHVVPLSKELEYLRLYVEIQKVRFGRRLAVSTSVPDELCDVCVPKFSLQPLVENAIVHGIEPRPEGGLVEVCARVADEGETLEIQVRDNGVGMDPEILHAVRSGRRKATTQIGLKNIHERIRTSVGDGYGLTIESEVQLGTTVTVRLPAQGCPEMSQ